MTPMTALDMAWAVLVSALVWRCRPGPAARRPGSPHSESTPKELVSLVGSIDRVGRLVTERVALLGETSPRLVGSTVIATVIAVIVIGPIAVPGGASVLGAAGVIARRRQARAQAVVLAQLAPAVEMVRIAVAGGCTARDAVVVAGRHVPDDGALGLARLVSELERGLSLDEGLRAWVDRVGSPTDELADLLRSSDEGGVVIVAALDRLAADLRRRRRRSAEERARRLPVTMLLPLVMCILPAFGLVTVVPMLAVGLQSVVNDL